MLSSKEFVRQSLELNLFFMRILKEHSIFLEAGIMPKDHLWASQADMLKNEFSQLLIETIRLSQGIISPEVANSGELVTDLTFPAERETECLSGIEIDSNITRMEEALIKCPQTKPSAGLERRVSQLNSRAIIAVKKIICFKSALLDNVLTCRMFTANYPLLIDHILREAKLYLRILTMLQDRQEVNLAKELAYQENFWNRIMAEHAKFIRGLLDPTEVKLFDTANDFGKKFDALTAETKLLMKNLNLLPKTTEDALKNTIEIRDFKKQGTEGLISCNIRSIMVPLLGDHVLREANHYIRLLKSFKC
ncbi:DUF2935 domain-containing protein [uncultured Clostridium sp.]|uniref:DUF2935 domain-containing protein n=1 Tax=uncultured Clostridium sp. TaxID=59620 RepID=UPI0028E47E9A|nr:DUF2935 domain-containing protein [uncultured Clostridium sp.]